MTLYLTSALVVFVFAGGIALWAALLAAGVA